MSAIYTIIEQLASDNSRLAKEAILKKNTNNELLKQVFNLALNPFVQFYIRKIPSYDTAGDLNRKSLQEALENLSVLSDRVMPGHASMVRVPAVTQHGWCVARIVVSALPVGLT